MHKFLRRLRLLTNSSLYALRILFKWICFGTFTGVAVGAVSTVFYHCLRFAGSFRLAHPQMILGLPVGGLIIVGLYHFMRNDPGTNLVISAIHSDEEIPGRMAPLIFISTFLTTFSGLPPDVRVRRCKSAAAFRRSLGNCSMSIQRTGTLLLCAA